MLLNKRIPHSSTVSTHFDSSGGRKAQANSVGDVRVAFNKSTFPEGFIMVVSELHKHAYTHIAVVTQAIRHTLTTRLWTT
jgi:hypothetical protein